MKETINVRLKHPIITGFWIAFGFFLFWIIVAILGGIVMTISVVEALNDLK